MRLEDLRDAALAEYRVAGKKCLSRAEIAFRAIANYFGEDAPADALTYDVLMEYAAKRMETCASGTVRLELAYLRKGFVALQKAGKIKLPAFPSVKASDPRQGFFEDAQEAAIIALLPPDIAVCIRFLSLTGWRVSEARRLAWVCVDFVAGTVRLEPGTTKNKDGRTFPFSALPPLEALLVEQRARTDALERQYAQVIPLVFWRHFGGRVRPCDWHARLWRRRCAEAGYPGKLVHDLRRTAVRRLERAGVSRSVAMKLTGHRTEAVYKRYAIVNEADLGEGVAKLAEFILGSVDKGKGQV